MLAIEKLRISSCVIKYSFETQKPIIQDISVGQKFSAFVFIQP